MNACDENGYRGGPTRTTSAPAPADGPGQPAGRQPYRRPPDTVVAVVSVVGAGTVAYITAMDDASVNVRAGEAGAGQVRGARRPGQTNGPLRPTVRVVVPLACSPPP